MQTKKLYWLVSLSWMAASCGMDGGSYLDDPGLSKAEITPDSLSKCQVKVAGQWLDMETEYLPKVIACENDAADWEAMLANVISARTYAYYIQYQERKNGELFDDIRDQTFNCKNPVNETIRAAIRATSGQVLTYRGNLIAGFYVLGASVAGEGADDPCMGEGSSGSERYVTYNDGNYGSDVNYSKIGSRINANRGCMSQRGAECLSLDGYEHYEILKYFYGEDIVLEGAKCQGFGDLNFPEPQTQGISLSCEGCDLSTHDCVYRIDDSPGYDCVPKSDACEVEDNEALYRQCECGGYQSCEWDYGFAGTASWSIGCKDSEGMFACETAPTTPVGPVSATCDGCDLSTNDCLYENKQFKCVPQSDQCESYGGTTAKQCDCDGWMYCLKSGAWSGNCGAAPQGFFKCE